MVEDQVAAAETAIANGDAPDVAGDSYLYVGDMIGDLAMTYDWCSAFVTPISARAGRRMPSRP